MFVESQSQHDARKKNFTYHPPREGQPERYRIIRDAGESIAAMLNTYCPPSRELALAHTKLEEVIMWANAAIARNEHHESPNTQSDAPQEACTEASPAFDLNAGEQATKISPVFKFNIGDKVLFLASEPHPKIPREIRGTVVCRAQQIDHHLVYEIEFMGSDGRATSRWYSESSIRLAPKKSNPS